MRRNYKSSVCHCPIKKIVVPINTLNMTNLPNLVPLSRDQSVSANAISGLAEIIRVVFIYKLPPQIFIVGIEQWSAIKRRCYHFSQQFDFYLLAFAYQRNR